MSQPPRGKSRFKRVITWCAAGLAALVVFVVLLPTLISWGLFQGFITDAIQSRIDGRAEIKGLSLGWFSGQRVEGLSIVSADRDTTIDANVSLDKGLLGLMFAGGDYGAIRLSGEMSAMRYEDGTTSFERLLKPADPGKPAPPEASSSGPPHLRARLLIEGLTIKVRDRTIDQNLALNDLRADVDLDLAQAITFDLRSGTRVGATEGRLEARGKVVDPFTPEGAFNVDGLIVTVDATIQSFPVAMLEALTGLGSRLSTVAGDVLERATVNIDGDLERAAVAFSVAAPRLNVDGKANLQDGRLIVRQGSPVTMRLTPRDDTLGAWLPADLARTMGLNSRPSLAPGAGGEPTSVEVRIDAASINVPRSGGGLNLTRGSVDASIITRSARVDLPGHPDVQVIDLSGLILRVSASDLSRQVDVSLDLSATVNQFQPTTVTASLAAVEMLSPAGAFAFDPARLAGTFKATRLPAVMAQRFLAGTPVVIERDLGPTLDVEAAFAQGETRAISLSAAAANLVARVEADVDSKGGLNGRTLVVETDLRPELVAGFAGERGLRLPRRLRASFDQFALPAMGGAAAFDPSIIAARGEVTLTGQPIIVNPALPPVDVTSLRLGLSTPGARQRVGLTGSIVAEGATINLDQSISGLFNASGAVDALNCTPVGTLSVANITPGLIARFAPDLPPVVAAHLNGALGLTVETRPAGRDLLAVVRVESPGLGANLTTRRTETEVLLESGTVRTALRPEVVSMVLNPGEGEEAGGAGGAGGAPPNPMQVSSESIVATFKPARLFTRAGGSYAADVGGFEADLRVSDIRVANAPGLPETEVLLLRRITAAVTGVLGERMSIGVKGDALVRADARQRKVADVAYDLRVARDAGGVFRPAATLNFTEFDVIMLEPLLGYPSGDLRRWLGDAGALRLEATVLDNGGYRAILAPAFPHFTGTFTASADADTVRVTSDRTAITLTAAAAASLLNPSHAEGAPAPTVQHSVAADVPMSLTIREFSLPAQALSLLRPPLPSTRAKIDVQLNATRPVSITRRDLAAGASDTITLNRFDVKVLCDDLAIGPKVQLLGVLRGTGDDSTIPESERSTLNATLTLRRLVDEERRLVFEKGALDADIRVNRFPTWLIDAYSGRNSLLVDALGPTVSADIRTRGLSATTGRINASLDAANGSTARTALAVGEKRYILQRDQPTAASLEWTESLRKRVLYQIHTIFADIRTVEKPIQVTITQASVPSDNDLSKLNADITISVGAVEFESGSQFLKILQYVNTQRRDTIPGHVGDLVVQIRNGVLAYENFVISIGGDRGDRQRLVFAGNVDLGRKVVNAIVAAYPVADIRNSIEGLRFVPDGVSVGIKFSGPLYDARGEPLPLKTEPIIDVKMEDIIKQQVKDKLPKLPDVPGRLGDLFRRDGGG